eukprot:CAMPEP_0194272784 /NCGR_PEP_ID=MMETSP0169-20130528/6254_1 /TAXON_ID=218684 /ORGANISM="Corethron pennatum, Strain L29A3" /LENGTH=359 /DNA_ID=CAMNT_0039015531 /DNA_START=53 /DNA_END=1129 /DNA_ORIENTATION=+
MEGLFAAELIECGCGVAGDDAESAEAEGRVPPRIEILREGGAASVPVPGGGKIPLDLTVLYEPGRGGGGGGGRIYVIVTGDGGGEDVEGARTNILRALGDPGCVSHVALKSGLISESAAVHGSLYCAAGKIARRLFGEEEGWRRVLPPAGAAEGEETGGEDGGGEEKEGTDDVERERTAKSIASIWKNVSNVHVVGHGMAGGVAGLVGAILEGSLPLPAEVAAKKSKKKPKRKRNPALLPLAASSLPGKITGTLLGPPPVLSPVVACPFLTSVLYGDDLIPRVSPRSFSRLHDRAVSSRKIRRKVLSAVGASWISASVSASVEAAGARAAGREGEESRLGVPGVAFMVRPRRMGGGAAM